MLRTTIVPQSEQTLEVSRVGYQTDQVDFLVLIDNQRILLDTQVDYFRALGGQTVTRTVEGRERYPVNVRYARSFRETLLAIEQVPVRTATGAHVPLGQLATVEINVWPRHGA